MLKGNYDLTITQYLKWSLPPNEIKQNLLHLLEAIAGFCDEKGICYFLAWVTLLGAVRHKGFIPWDDDVDIWMPRPDYNRFVNEFRHGTYVFRSMEKEEDWPLCFGKVCDMNYQACDEFGHDYGLFVDVFPLDGLPDDENQRERHIATVRKKERMWSSQVLTRKLSLSKAYPLSKNLSIIAARFLHPFYPERKVIGGLLKEYQRYSWEDSSIVTDFHESRVINWMASSAFAIYLYQENVLIRPYFKSVANAILSQNGFWAGVVELFLFLCCVAVLCILVDKLRQAIWRVFAKEIR